MTVVMTAVQEEDPQETVVIQYPCVVELKQEVILSLCELKPFVMFLSVRFCLSDTIFSLILQLLDLSGKICFVELLTCVLMWAFTYLSMTFQPWRELHMWNVATVLAVTVTSHLVSTCGTLAHSRPDEVRHTSKRRNSNISFLFNTIMLSFAKCDVVLYSF